MLPEIVRSRLTPKDRRKARECISSRAVFVSRGAHLGECAQPERPRVIARLYLFGLTKTHAIRQMNKHSQRYTPFLAPILNRRQLSTTHRRFRFRFREAGILRNAPALSASLPLSRLSRSRTWLQFYHPVQHWTFISVRVEPCSIGSKGHRRARGLPRYSALDCLTALLQRAEVDSRFDSRH